MQHVYANMIITIPRAAKLASIITCNLNNVKYVDPALQIPLSTSLAHHNTIKNKQLVQNRNQFALAPRETQILNSKFPPIRRHSISNFKRPSKKRITRVRFNDTSRAANQQPSSQNSTRLANPPSNTSNNTRTASQRTTSNNTTRAASPLQILTQTSPAHSSYANTPLTPSPHVPTFDYIVSKIFNKSLIASLTSKDAVLKGVRDCILTNNESRLKALNPYIHSYWRDLHVRSGCMCIDEKVAIPNVLRESLTEDYTQAIRAHGARFALLHIAGGPTCTANST